MDGKNKKKGNGIGQSGQKIRPRESSHVYRFAGSPLHTGERSRRKRYNKQTYMKERAPEFWAHGKIEKIKSG